MRRDGPKAEYNHTVGEGKGMAGRYRLGADNCAVNIKKCHILSYLKKRRKQAVTKLLALFVYDAT